MWNKKRVRDGVKYGLIYTVVIMTLGLLLIEIFAQPFAGLFGLSGETEQICIDAMRIISVSFIFAGINIAFQGVYQALDSGIESLVISVCRQILFILPIAWLFTIIAGMRYSWIIWLTFPIGEIVSAMIGTLFLIRINKRKISVMNRYKKNGFAHKRETVFLYF